MAGWAVSVYGRIVGWTRSVLPRRIKSTFVVCGPAASSSLSRMLSTAECVYDVSRTVLPCSIVTSEP